MVTILIRFLFIPFVFGIYLLSGKSIFWASVSIIFIVFSTALSYSKTTDWLEEIKTIGELIIFFAGAIGIFAYFTFEAALFWSVLLLAAYIFEYARRPKPGVNYKE